MVEESEFEASRQKKLFDLKCKRIAHITDVLEWIKLFHNVKKLAGKPFTGFALSLR